jgi:oxygen-independent coproporphyrinogen-3 oxidase
VGEARQSRQDQEVFQDLKNLYIHFPFCRRKCSYCALRSRAGITEEERAAYVSALVRAVESSGDSGFKTVYFGGGTPALCDLGPLLEAVAPRLGEGAEFTVELNPLDVAPACLATLKSGGVNRISMGLQSVDDAVLADMRRGYGFAEAERAFYLVREYFENVGVDLIVGYPGELGALYPRHAQLAKWGLKHCSVYSLILEEKTPLYRRCRGRNAGGAVPLPDDDTVMNRLATVASFMEDIGLERYEISNYASPGYECRHNMAVWRGEDYLGLGDGAHGRTGRLRTRNAWSCREPFTDAAPPLSWSLAPETETVSEEADCKERAVFALRTREGIDADAFPGWRGITDKFVAEGLMEEKGSFRILTARGMEVCDSIIGELI